MSKTFNDSMSEVRTQRDLKASFKIQRPPKKFIKLTQDVAIALENFKLASAWPKGFYIGMYNNVYENRLEVNLNLRYSKQDKEFKNKLKNFMKELNKIMDTDFEI